MIRQEQFSAKCRRRIVQSYLKEKYRLKTGMIYTIIEGAEQTANL